MDAQLGQNLAQSVLGMVPHGVIVMVFLLVSGVAQGQHAAVVGDVEVLVDIKNQVADIGDLALDLLRRAEQVRVVLAEVTAALDALQRAGGLIAEVVGDLADADGQLAVAVGLVGVDHHVVGAVHRAQDVALALHLHGGEHVLTVVIPVTGGLVQVHGADAGGHDMQVAALALLALDIILQLLPDGVAVGQEHRQAAADKVVGHEQAHFLADLAVVALTRFLLLLLPRVQLLLIAEGNAIDAGQHLVLFVVLPVCAGLLGDLEGLECLGVAQVGSDAHVNILALLIEAELGLVSEVGNMLDLVMLLTLLHQLDSLITRQDERLDGKILLADLLHLFLDVGQILIAEFGVAQINIVEKAVLGRGAKGKVRLRVEALDGLGHDVGCRVAQNVQFFFLRALGNGAVLVDDLHGCTLLLHSCKQKMLHPLRHTRDEALKSSTVPPKLRLALIKKESAAQAGCNGPYPAEVRPRARQW